MDTSFCPGVVAAEPRVSLGARFRNEMSTLRACETCMHACMHACMYACTCGYTLHTRILTRTIIYINIRETCDAGSSLIASQLQQSAVDPGVVGSHHQVSYRKYGFFCKLEVLFTGVLIIRALLLGV